MNGSSENNTSQDNTEEEIPTNIAFEINKNEITITYSLNWHFKIMKLSAISMVPFKFFSQDHNKQNVDDRSYPRSRDNPGFYLLEDKKKNIKPEAGGRKHVDFSQVPDLCGLLGHQELEIPISDIAIVSKRAVCRKTIDRRKKYMNFAILDGSVQQQKPDWTVYDYPLLCIIGGKGGAFTNTNTNTQGEWRIVQCVFGAALTLLLREEKIGIEVVSREGFGSLFPTLADLPDGIRLVPGLLPPIKGAEAITTALHIVDEFIQLSKKNKFNYINLANKMNGYDKEKLANLDNLMCVLLKDIDMKVWSKDNFLSKFTVMLVNSVKNNNGGSCDFKLKAMPDFKITYTITAEMPKIGALKFLKRRKSLEVESGYGSESDWEEDESIKHDKPKMVKENLAQQKFKEKTDKDEIEISIKSECRIPTVKILVRPWPKIGLHRHGLMPAAPWPSTSLEDGTSCSRMTLRAIGRPCRFSMKTRPAPVRFQGLFGRHSLSLSFLSKQRR